MKYCFIIYIHEIMYAQNRYAPWSITVLSLRFYHKDLFCQCYITLTCYFVTASLNNFPGNALIRPWSCPANHPIIFSIHKLSCYILGVIIIQLWHLNCISYWYILFCKIWVIIIILLIYITLLNMLICICFRILWSECVISTIFIYHIIVENKSKIDFICVN